MASRLNHRSPAVKRILQEIKEMRELMDASPATPFAAEPLESDIFQWQFVIKGAVDTYESKLMDSSVLASGMASSACALECTVILQNSQRSSVCPQVHLQQNLKMVYTTAE